MKKASFNKRVCEGRSGNELAEKKIIKSVADYHYAFMGATEPQKMEHPARNIARIMKNDAVDAVLLVPV